MQFVQVFYLLFLVLIQIESSWLPQKIWTYWNEPLQQDAFMSLFHKNRIKYSQGWQVILLTPDNLLTYLKQIPSFKGLPKSFNELKISHQADLIRITVIAHLGGVWVDFSTFFIQHIEWIELENLKNDSNVQNIHGEKPDVLLFTLNWFQVKQYYQDPLTNKKYHLFPGYQIWFLAAIPNSKFMLELYAKLIDAIQHQAFNYEKVQRLGINYVDQKARQQNIIVNNQSDYLVCNQLIQYIIQKKQSQLDLQTSNSQRQLAIWYYNIWHIDSFSGPYKSYIDQQFIGSQHTDILVYQTEYSLKKLYGGFRYFIKLNMYERRTIQQYFIQPSNFLQVVYSFGYYYKQDFLVKYFCPQYFGIRNGSLIHKYLIGDQQKFLYLIKYSSALPHQRCTKFNTFETLAIIYMFVMIFLIPFALPALIYVIIRYFCGQKNKVYHKIQGQDEHHGKQYNH